jgi:ferredoxin
LHILTFFGIFYKNKLKKEEVFMPTPVVDYELCVGCGSCVEVCPEVFEVRDDQKCWVIGPDKCNTCDCQQAADLCPSQAIKLE